jgi:hypothetical protein
MVDVEKAKAFLKEHHVKSVTWHHVLNNTTSTRPKTHGGKVVRSLTDHKHYEAQGAGFATPMMRCTIRLPNSFAPDDRTVFEVTGAGPTRDAASEDACCGAMVQLLCAEPNNVVLRPAHWTIPIGAILTQFLEQFGDLQPGTLHQPLAVHRPRGDPAVKIDMDDQKKQAVEEILRRCLNTHDGAFDPSVISRKRYGLEDDAPWVVLDSLLNKGDLRTFVEQHTEFAWRPHGPKGMIITWASDHAPAAGASSSGQALPALATGASSSQAAADGIPEPPKDVLLVQSFYEKCATSRWLLDESMP